MATRECRLTRGRRRGEQLTARAISELRDARTSLGISQAALARQLNCWQAHLWRIEAGQVRTPSLVRLAEMASVLGLELSIGLHPIGDAIRDRGQQALAGRFRAMISAAWSVTAETPLPMPGDLRAWDLLLRLPATDAGDGAAQLVGADLETRIRDVQALVRRTRQRERDGGVDHILIVLSDSATNRRLVHELRVALGGEYATAPRTMFAALRTGRPLPGSGVLLI